MAAQDASLTQAPVTPAVPLGQRWERWLAPYAFISPFFVAFVAFQLIPIAFSVYLSLAEWNGMRPIEFVGLDNFVTLMRDGKFWNAFRVSLTLTAVCTVLGTAGALALAVLLEKVPDRLASLLRVAFFLPSVTSVVVIAYIWKQMYSADYGYFNTFLASFGLPPQDWLTNARLALPALIVMLVWAGLGWDALIFGAGLRSIPEELYDAARVDGASGWAEFWHVTLPLLRPTLVFILVTSVIFMWGLFAQPQLLTGGEPLRRTQTIALYLYEAGFRYHKFGYASAIAVVLSALMFITSYLNIRLVRSEIEY